MVAACWSPAMPVIAIGAPKCSARVMPSAPALSVTSPRAAIGTPNRSHKPPSQLLPVSGSRLVRLALLASLISAPPVSLKVSHVSMVPKASRPLAAAAPTAGSLSISQRILVAEK